MKSKKSFLIAAGFLVTSAALLGSAPANAQSVSVGGSFRGPHGTVSFGSGGYGGYGGYSDGYCNTSGYGHGYGNGYSHSYGPAYAADDCDDDYYVPPVVYRTYRAPRYVSYYAPRYRYQRRYFRHNYVSSPRYYDSRYSSYCR